MGEGNLYCPTSQRVQRWERMGEDVAGSLDGKGRRGALLALQSTVFASSQTLQLQASQVRGWQVRSSRGVYEGKEGNAASFYTNNSHNPADVALATSHSELAGVAGSAGFGGLLSSQFAVCGFAEYARFAVAGFAVAGFTVAGKRFVRFKL